MANDYLMHYGVKGMKWGVRKSRSTTGKTSKVGKYFKITSPAVYGAYKGTKRAGKAVKNSQFIKNRKKSAKRMANKYRNVTGSRKSAARTKYQNKNIDRMTNQQLQEAVYRMNLERQYRDLTKADIMRGQKAAQDVMKYKTTYKALSSKPKRNNKK